MASFLSCSRSIARMLQCVVVAIIMMMMVFFVFFVEWSVWCCCIGGGSGRGDLCNCGGVLLDGCDLLRL